MKKGGFLVKITKTALILRVKPEVSAMRFSGLKNFTLKCEVLNL